MPDNTASKMRTSYGHHQAIRMHSQRYEGGGGHTVHEDGRGGGKPNSEEPHSSVHRGRKLEIPGRKEGLENRKSVRQRGKKQGHSSTLKANRVKRSQAYQTTKAGKESRS